jgi:hypothetical protein
LICGAAVLLAGWIGLLSSNYPTIYCPFPALTFLPALILSNDYLAVAIPALCFFLWYPGLFRGNSKIPKRSVGLLICSILLSILYFVASWRWGLQYEGPYYTHTVCLLNAAWILILGAMFYWSRKKTPTFAYNLIVHGLFFVWLAWYAFPQLGELP